MGFAAVRKIKERHYAGVQGGLRAEHHGEEAGHVRAQQS